jgi:hypothetical protein
MSHSAKDVFYISGQDVYCWAEQQSSVMLKAVTQHGDPVELTATEARKLAKVLLRLADEVEK